MSMVYFLACIFAAALGFAFVLGKPIYLLNPLPDNPYLRAEAEAMMPIVLNGNLDMIGERHATTL